MGREGGCEAWRCGGDVRMGERKDILVGPEAEKIGDRGVRFNQHQGYLRDIEREELGTKGGWVIGPMDEEELLFAIL